MFDEPISETLACVPVAVVEGILRNNETLDVNPIGLKRSVQAIATRHPVVAYQRIRQDQDLSLVRRIRQGFEISDHTGVKHHFA